MPRAIPIEEEIGKRYGRLTVVAFSHYRKLQKGALRIYTCRCDCGSQLEANRTNLRCGITASCGCLQKDRASASSLKHGMAKRCPEYTAWLLMKSRCLNPKNRSWTRYGGRGIQIYAEWIDSFQSFFQYLGPKPTPKHSIDRINNDGNYEPGNVRWATAVEQANNKSTNRMVTVDGRSHTVSQWSREVGIHPSSLHERLSLLGWDEKDAVLLKRTQPKRIEYNGRSLTIRQWSEYTGIPYYALKSRINSPKWTIKDAIECLPGKLGSNCREYKP